MSVGEPAHSHAQHPGRESGSSTRLAFLIWSCRGAEERNGTTVIRLDMTRSHSLTMSPEVRKKLYGHHPSPICPGLPPSVMFCPWWQFSTSIALPV